MATSRKITTSELDFDKIKQSLKDYLRGQDQFSDYDFDGSGLSILLDVLAYNTHYKALYDNMAINEAFLDSASKRANVVSRAKELGYVPGSAKSATAVVNLTISLINNLNAPQSYELPRYTPFRTKVDDKEYTFYTTETHIAYLGGSNNNQYVFENIVLREGIQVKQSFAVDAYTSAFTLANPNVDTTTIRVTVQESAQSSTFETYYASNTLLNLDGESRAFFLSEIDNQLYRIEFGNGVVGKALEPGNLVTVEYIVTNADVVNGARTFAYGGALASNTQAFVTTITPAFGGSIAESVDSIKWNAPRAYAAQNRCVTLDDYRSVITALYPNAFSINVWGGEQNFPPSYGDVYISIRPTNADFLTEGEKDYILNEILEPRRITTVHPKIVDPTYLYVELNTSFYYNPDLTNRTSNDLTALVRQAIFDYESETLDRFGGVMKHSALSRAIDLCEDSIQSSITTVKIHREVEPVYNRTVQYIVDIGNPIYNAGVAEGAISSSGFNVLNVVQTVYLDDLPTEGKDIGLIRLYYLIGTTKVYLGNVGTVNYKTGVVTLNDLTITGLVDPAFKLIIKPQSNDVVSTRNQIVTIAPELLTIRPVIDTGASNYSFTSSRN